MKIFEYYSFYLKGVWIRQFPWPVKNLRPLFMSQICSGKNNFHRSPFPFFLPFTWWVALLRVVYFSRMIPHIYLIFYGVLRFFLGMESFFRFHNVLCVWVQGSFNWKKIKYLHMGKWEFTILAISHDTPNFTDFFVFFLFEKGRIIPTTKGFCVERMHSPLTELNQCAFPCDSYLMFEPSRQQGCTTLGAFILRIKPHSSTPFFVSVWYKGQVVQFEQKAEISTKVEISEKIQIVLLIVYDLYCC